MAHQPAVPRDIAREDSRQSAFDPHCRHRASLVELTLRRCPRLINCGSAGSPLADIGIMCYMIISNSLNYDNGYLGVSADRAHRTTLRCPCPCQPPKNGCSSAEQISTSLGNSILFRRRCVV